MIRGRLGIGAAKARDPQKMRGWAVGRLAKARNGKANLAGMKSVGVLKHRGREMEVVVVEAGHAVRTSELAMPADMLALAS